MNCPNCNCQRCIEDRKRTDLQAHRLKVIESWNWNAPISEAASSLQEELRAGRGGTEKQWHDEIRSYFNEPTASRIITLTSY